MRRATKKLSIFTVCLVIVGFLAFQLIFPMIAGASKYKPVTLQYQLSPYAKSLVNRAFEQIKQPADYHVHLLGIDNSKQTYINPEFLSILNPVKRFRYHAFMHASQVQSLETSLKDYQDRLLDQLNHMPSLKAHIYAFDSFHDEDGNSDLSKSDFYISSDLIVDLAKQHPDNFVPVISIHPYRKDAVKELNRFAKRGVKFIKWLPNSMNIDPTAKKNDNYYQTMLKNDMVLIVHGGEEHAVSSHSQSFGNPLLYRYVLDKGLKLIVAHAATMGECADTDLEDQPMVPCFDLMKRLLDEPKYKNNLYVDISSIYLSNHNIEYVRELLDSTQHHDRFLYGSDYPLVALNIMVNLGKLVDAELITAKEAKALKEIYQYNPMLFGFVTSRTLRSPSGAQFSPVVFEQRSKF